MAQSSGFFKGEKKKKKQGKDKGLASFSTSSAPTFSVPEVISKKKKEY